MIRTPDRRIVRAQMWPQRNHMREQLAPPMYLHLLIVMVRLRTPNAVYVREKQSEPPCAGTKLATINSAVLKNATLHHAAPIWYLRYRYSVSSGAASTHGLNTVTLAFSKSLASPET